MANSKVLVTNANELGPGGKSRKNHSSFRTDLKFNQHIKSTLWGHPYTTYEVRSDFIQKVVTIKTSDEGSQKRPNPFDVIYERPLCTHQPPLNLCLG